MFKCIIIRSVHIYFTQKLKCQVAVSKKNAQDVALKIASLVLTVMKRVHSLLFACIN